MSKRNTYITVIFIFILAFFAINLNYPVYFNKGTDFINAKTNLKIPHFWEKPFQLGLDLQGGFYLVYEADFSNTQVAEKDKAAIMEGLRDVIERRINLFGVKEPSVKIQKQRLIVELAGVKSSAEALQMIGQTPYLEFKEPKSNYQEIITNNQKIYEAGKGELEDPFQSTSLTGRYLVKSEVTFASTTNKPEISLQFNDEGAKIFEELTSRNVGKPLAIYVDQQLLSAPTVQEAISGGKAQITGNFTVEEAQKLARNLNAGALPVNINLISHQSVGPTLGKISLEKSLKAGILGFLAVIIFMILFYRLPGLLASLALGIYVAIILSLFKLIPVTLTLAGIAGFILSIGMAVDANILIFARMREEIKEGKPYSAAMEEGFRRAWSSIRDSNSNTLIVSLILFTFGTSFVKGFAFTLILGVLVSMFSAVFITTNFLRLFKSKKEGKVGWLWR